MSRLEHGDFALLSTITFSSALICMATPYCSNTHRDSRHFSPSLSASYASSTTSRTSSKWSTIWGPGTLSGKALEAFGEVMLRGVENLVIRRQLASLRSIFPHTNDAVIHNIDHIYDNVLELSRFVIEFSVCLYLSHNIISGLGFIQRL